MKTFIALAIVILSNTSHAQSLRSECENAYYATGYVKLHEYTVTVTWAKISDHAHKNLEDIIFDNFKVLEVKELSDKSIYKIQENSTNDSFGYEILLNELKEIPTRVACTYDI